MSDIVPTKSDDVSNGSNKVAIHPVAELRPPWPGWTILVLIAAHVLAGAALAFETSRPNLAFFGNPVTRSTSMILVSLIVCQCSLVGLWGAMGELRQDVRLAGMGAAAVYLGMELSWSLGGDRFVVVLIAMFPAVVIFRLVGHFTVIVRRIDEPGAARNGLQYSIRSLMLLTIVIACLLSLGPLLAPYLRLLAPYLRSYAVLGFGACHVSMVLASMWAMLGLANPVRRCLVVLSLSATVGWFAASVEGASPGYPIGIMLLHAFFLLGSLFVVRRCGYYIAAKASAMPAAGN